MRGLFSQNKNENRKFRTYFEKHDLVLDSRSTNIVNFEINKISGVCLFVGYYPQVDFSKKIM